MMLALANRTGLRLGEVCGLRLSDLDTIPKGFLTVSHSYANPLKEDRRGVGKVKKAPAPVDVAEALKMHVSVGAFRAGARTTSCSCRRKRRTAAGERLARLQEREHPRSVVGGMQDGEARRRRGQAHRDLVRLDPDDAGTRAAKADVPIEQITKSLGHASPRSPKSTTSSFSARTSTRRCGCRCCRSWHRRRRRPANAARDPTARNRSRSPNHDVRIVRGVAVGHRIVRSQDGASGFGADDHAAAQPDAGGHRLDRWASRPGEARMST